MSFRNSIEYLNTRMPGNIADNFEIRPPGLIPEFNALGNHPKDMKKYIDTHVKGAFARMNIEDKYSEARKIFMDALDALVEQAGTFTGHHIPDEKTKPVLKLIFDTFVDLEKSNFIGSDHFQQAVELAEKGNNILIVQNHTSPMDALVPLALIEKEYQKELPISIIMSQVFEYARATNLITCGVDKFPVFQPKHIKIFHDKKDVQSEMFRQNAIALRSMATHAKQGGKMFFLYPEKSRNTDAMGVLEPGSMAVPNILSKTGHSLYVLPTFVSGVESIFPNSPGRNELDDFFEIIKKGSGNFYCGKPIEYSNIVAVAESLPIEKQIEIARKTTDGVLMEEKVIQKSVISSLMLGEIAKLSDDENKKGIYADHVIQDLVATLDSES